MTSEILPVPEIKKGIIDAVDNGTLVVFIGAGVSRLIGCMGWDQLARNLVNRCFSTGLINFKEKETLIQSKDHKKIITICYYLLKKNGFKDTFYDEFERSLEADTELLRSQNIYDELYLLNGLFITTNVDKHFDSKFDRTQIVYKEEAFDSSNIGRKKLYHIHGSIEDKNSLIFTVPQYIKRYSNEGFKKFLGKIFSEEHTVLFVGYGLAEFELLDFLITKFDSVEKKGVEGKKPPEIKHYILLPFYRGEENILEFEQYYYKSMGIEVLAYEKDEKGYEQLYKVIHEWNTKINQVPFD